MRFFSLLLFTLTLPISVFLGTILYGGYSTAILKTELTKSGVYDKVLSVLREPSAGDTTYQEQQQDQVISAIAVFINKDYLQKKTENTIDDVSAWITGSSSTPPTLSFKEIKAEIEEKNPGLLNNVQELSNSMSQQANGETSQEKPVEKNMLSDFIKNDFSFPLKDNLQSVKDAYENIKIIFPLSIVLLFTYVAMLLLFNVSWTKRLRWTGTAFLLGAIWAYVVALVFTFGLQAGIHAILTKKEALIQTIIPILQRLITPFTTQYLSYQTIVSLVCLVLGVIILIASFMIKEQTNVEIVPVKKLLPKKQKKKKGITR